MTQYLCTEEVWRPGHWSPHRCGKTAKHDPTPDGKPTRCGIHCNEAKAKRDAKKAAQMRKYRDRSDAAIAVFQAREAVETALRTIAAGHNDPRSLAAETIAALDAAIERAKRT